MIRSIGFGSGRQRSTVAKRHGANDTIESCYELFRHYMARLWNIDLPEIRTRQLGRLNDIDWTFHLRTFCFFGCVIYHLNGFVNLCLHSRGCAIDHRIVSADYSHQNATENIRCKNWPRRWILRRANHKSIQTSSELISFINLLIYVRQYHRDDINGKNN